MATLTQLTLRVRILDQVLAMLPEPCVCVCAWVCVYVFVPSFSYSFPWLTMEDFLFKLI